MSRHEKAAPRRTRLSGSGRTRALLSLGVVLGLGAVGTLAAWSDTATAETGIFSTAASTVEIELDGETAHEFVTLNKVNFKRGGSIAGMLPVQNVGTANFTYTSTMTATDNGTNTAAGSTASALASQLTVSVYKGGAATGDNNAGTGSCSSTEQVASNTMTVGTTGLISSPRPINVAQSEDLCFKISLAPNATKEARMAALNIVFDFTATRA